MRLAETQQAVREQRRVASGLGQLDGFLRRREGGAQVAQAHLDVRVAVQRLGPQLRYPSQAEHVGNVARGVAEPAQRHQRFGALVEQTNALVIAHPGRHQGVAGLFDRLGVQTSPGQVGDLRRWR